MTSTYTTRAVDTELGPLYVRQRGEGRPLFFWHSLYVDSRSFDAMVDELGDGYHVVLVDGPGHGRSPGPGRLFTLEQCADAAVAVLAELGLSEVDWVGSAWGGHIGAVLAARSDAPLRSFAAFCAPMQPVEARARAHLLVALYRAFGLRGPVRAGLLDALLDPARRREDPSLEAYVVSTTSPPDRAPLVLAMRSVMLARHSLVERLADIAVPALFVTGDNPLWPVDLAREQAAMLRRGEFVHIPGVRHLPPLEAPRRSAEVLRAWLDAAT